MVQQFKAGLRNLVTHAALRIEPLLRPAVRNPVAAPKTILILQFPSTLGCLVLETPVFRALRRCCPEARIVVATSRRGIEVLRHSPDVDELILTPEPGLGLARSVRALRSGLRGRGLRPECVLTCMFGRRLAIGRLAALAVAGWRGGFTELPALYRRPLEIDHSLSVLENNLRVAALLGWRGPTPEPAVFFSAAELDAAKRHVDAARRAGRAVLTVISQGNHEPNWHDHRFAEVVRHAAAMGFEVLYPGTSGEAENIARLQRMAGTGTSLAGPMSIGELAALLAISDLVVAVDTGPMHIARATGVPMVVLAGCWAYPHVWLPIHQPHVRILQGPYRRGLPESDRMDDIEAAAVIAAIIEVADRYPASAAERSARMHALLSNVDHAPCTDPLQSAAQPA